MSKAIQLGSLFLLSIAFGLIAASGSVTMSVLAAGLFGGLFFFAYPAAGVTIILLLGLLSGVTISLLGPSSNQLAWGITLLGLLLFARSLFSLAVRPKEVPGFVWLAIAFMAYCLVATAIRFHSTGELIAGTKRYFQMYGLMLAIAVLPFSRGQVNGWLRLMLGLALLQLPFAIYERFVLAGRRGHGAEATDVVAGTLGANISGGSANAEMAAFVIMASLYLLARQQAGLLSRTTAVALGLICLVPLALGETKFVLVLLPIGWMIVMWAKALKRPLGFSLQLIAISALLVLLGSLYVGLNRGSAAEVLDLTLRYNVGSMGYGLYRLNRTSAITFWWDQNGWRDIIGTLIGHGLGSSYSNVINIVPGHKGEEFFGFGIDLTGASMLLWETGLIGLLLFHGILLSAWRSAQALHRSSPDSVTRADALAIQACIAFFALFVWYDNAIINFLPFECIFAAVLGYLGYLCRNEQEGNRTLPHKIAK